MRTLAKTSTYGVLHVSVATLVAYTLTGNLGVALGIGLIEPLVQTVVFYVHERVWERGKPKPRPTFCEALLHQH